jgi:hypothetical protein
MKRLMMAGLFLMGTLLAQTFPPELSVRNVTLVTATPIDFSDRQEIIRSIRASKLMRAPMSDDLPRSFAEITRDAFQQRGYFKAQVNHFDLRVVEDNPQREVVDLVAEVTPGALYRLRDISFHGGAVTPLDQLRHQFTIGDGDIFDISKMRTGLEHLRRLYGDHGYINFSAVPDTEIDEASHTIAVLIDIDEGHIYHMGKLLIDGDEWRPGTKAKLMRDWQKYRGRAFSPIVLRDFLRDEHASPDVDPDSLFRWEVINATPTWPNLDVPPYTINFRITLANPTDCRPAPGEKLVQLCWLAHPDRMPPAR